MMIRKFSCCAVVALSMVSSPLIAEPDPGMGPLIPGGKWHVNDPSRPRPPIVTPGAINSSPPSDAVILLGTNGLSQFDHLPDGGPKWTYRNGVIVPPKRDKTQEPVDIVSKDSFGDIQLHVEFRMPPAGAASGQDRGNSGIFFMGRYELQILDSYDNPTYADGQASAVYGYKPPQVNASRKPGEWQSYDIIFSRPRFDTTGGIIAPAYVTVFHNGVLTQNHQPYQGETRWRALATYTAHADALPLKFQDHGSPVAYRNIWVRRLEPYQGDDQ
jgi:hypothetical protein